MFKLTKSTFLKALIPFVVMFSLMGSFFLETYGASDPLILNAGLINESVNVYSQNSTNSNVLTTLSSGTYITLRSNETNGWYYVLYGDGLYGYIPSSSISQVSSEIKTVSGDTNVRMGPNTSYKVIGMLKKNEIFLSIGRESNGWYKILFDGINVSYVSNVYVDNTTSQSSNTTSAPVNNTVSDNTVVDTTAVNTTATNTTSAPVQSQGVLPKSVSTIISYDLKPTYILTLPITITPANANKNVTLTSDNPNVAYMKDGKIHATKTEGIAKITITTVNGLSTTCIVRVSEDGGAGTSSAIKAVVRAYDYVDLFGAGSNNPAIYNTGMLRVYLDNAYTDNRRYTDSAKFVWYCYRAANMFLEDKTTTTVTVEAMTANPGRNFTNLGYQEIGNLKAGDVLTWLNYYGQNSGHAAIYVGSSNGVHYVIDMSPSGIQQRAITTVDAASNSNQRYNVIRCTK